MNSFQSWIFTCRQLERPTFCEEAHFILFHCCPHIHVWLLAASFLWATEKCSLIDLLLRKKRSHPSTLIASLDKDSHTFDAKEQKKLRVVQILSLEALLQRLQRLECPYFRNGYFLIKNQFFFSALLRWPMVIISLWLCQTVRRNCLMQKGERSHETK